MEARPLHKRQSFSNFRSGLEDVGEFHNRRHLSMYGYPLEGGGGITPPRPLSFNSNWPLFACDWTGAGPEFVAVGTYNEGPHNRIHILATSRDASGNVSGFTNVADALVTLPQTKIAWDPALPYSHGILRVISSGDCLRLWDFDLQTGKLEAMPPFIKKNKGAPHGASIAPLTSFDWNRVDNNLVITSSIDTTCTLWDLRAETVRTQLIAHDSDVCDVAFVADSPHKFVSAGADGSARLFDLRSLDSSTIIFEMASPVPLLRVATSTTDENLLAAIAQNSNDIYVSDIRAPRNPVAVLQGHQDSVNSIRWAPAQVGRNILASGADDSQLLIWDMAIPETQRLWGCYTAESQINNIAWSPSGHTIASVSGRRLQGVSLR